LGNTGGTDSAVPPWRGCRGSHVRPSFVKPEWSCRRCRTCRTGGSVGFVGFVPATGVCFNQIMPRTWSGLKRPCGHAFTLGKITPPAARHPSPEPVALCGQRVAPLPDKTELTDLTSGAGVVSVVSVNSRPRMPLVRPSAASGTSPKPRAGWLSAFAALEGFASNSAGLPLQRAGSSAFRI